ncbi:FAD-dependent monooxygenase [Marinomonas sp. THO17]|uniref:FAD-dependent oxidoreductase n=1 Tax=Marinomonas sp. THO17 TaxID=3149048 RepID=UPI00336BF9C3
MIEKGKRVAIVGAGPGGISAALGLLKQGYQVTVYESHPEPKPLGGAVLLSVPVLAVLRYYGIDLDNFGKKTKVEFHNQKGKIRANLAWNPKVEKAFGIEGWHYGVLRKSAFGHMLAQLPSHVIQANKCFSHYRETEHEIELYFDNGDMATADILIGADGIRSKVSQQAFGEANLFHVGLRVWLAWCDPIEGLPDDRGVISHSDKYQASYFPMLHDGKPGFEWWFVEARKENAAEPKDPKAYLSNIAKDFASPMKRFIEATDFSRQIFPWDIYNRPSLKHWSKGRVVCIGDAVHPVSPYAAYGMGMAIEDGYFLAKFLGGQALTDINIVKDAFAAFEKQRVDYVNHQVEFARTLGNVFHKLPWPLAKVRDFIYDHTGLLNTQLNKDYLGTQEAMCLSMTDLHQSS